MISIVYALPFSCVDEVTPEGINQTTVRAAEDHWTQMLWAIEHWLPLVDLPFNIQPN